MAGTRVDKVIGGQDLWGASALVYAFLELVLAVLVLVTSLLYFVSLTFGRAFNLQLPASFGGGRPLGRSVEDKAEPEPLLCEHHAKQVALLRTSLARLALGMSSLCEVCALSVLTCSCRKGDHFPPESENPERSIAVQQGLAPGEGRQGVDSGFDGLSSKSRQFGGEQADVMDEVVLSTIKSCASKNKIGSTVVVCPLCNLPVVGAGAGEIRSVKRKFSRDLVERLRAGTELAGGSNRLCDVGQAGAVPMEQGSHAASGRSVDGLAAEGQGNASQGNAVCELDSERVAFSAIGRKGSAGDASDLDSDHRMWELDPDGKEGACRDSLPLDRDALHILYMELEEERNASASAASEAMAMIARLQEEKAVVQMEARQYERMAEERSRYDQQEISILRELVMKREQELLALEDEVSIYRRRLLGEKWATGQEVSSERNSPNAGLLGRDEDRSSSETESRGGNNAVDGTGAEQVSDLPVRTDSKFGIHDEEMRNREHRESLSEQDGRNLLELFDSAQPESERGMMRHRVESDGQDVTDAPTAGSGLLAQRSGTLSSEQSVQSVDPRLGSEQRTTSDIAKSRERLLNALKSTAALTILEDERARMSRLESFAEGSSGQQAARDAETARNLVLEENRLSVLEYVRKLEGQLGRKPDPQVARRSPVAKGLTDSQKEQPVEKDEEAERAEQEGRKLPTDLHRSVQAAGAQEMIEEQSQKEVAGLASIELELYKEPQFSAGGLPIGSSSVTGTLVNLKTGCSDNVDEFSATHANVPESQVLDVYEVSSGNGTDWRPEPEQLRLLPNDPELDGRAGETVQHFVVNETSNRLGKPDAHPLRMSDHGQSRVITKKKRENRRQGLDLFGVKRRQPEASSVLEESGMEHGEEVESQVTAGYTDWRTASMVSRDRYRMMMEEEALCLISRLESLEADRQSMRQTIDSLRRENGEMKVLQEIAQQLRELRGLEKKPLKTAEHWPQEEPSSSSSFSKGILSFTRLCCTVQTHLNNLARLFLRSADTGASHGEPVGLRLLQTSPPPPAATCITRGLKADTVMDQPSLTAITRGLKSGPQPSLTALLSDVRTPPSEGWVVDARSRHGTALGGW